MPKPLFSLHLSPPTHLFISPPSLPRSLQIPNNNQFSIAIDFIKNILKVKTSNSRFYNWFFFHSIIEMCTMCVIFSNVESIFFHSKLLRKSKAILFFFFFSLDYCLSSNVWRSLKIVFNTKEYYIFKICNY